MFHFDRKLLPFLPDRYLLEKVLVFPQTVKKQNIPGKICSWTDVSCDMTVCTKKPSFYHGSIKLFTLGEWLDMKGGWILFKGALGSFAQNGIDFEFSYLCASKIHEN